MQLGLTEELSKSKSLLSSYSLLSVFNFPLLVPGRGVVPRVPCALCNSMFSDLMAPNIKIYSANKYLNWIKISNLWLTYITFHSIIK